LDKTWLNYLNLSDEYERKARFMPGVLTGLPLLPVSAAYGGPLGAWLQVLLVGLGAGAIISVGISHLASAFGNRLQKRLWPDWPHDSPTNQWLHPDDKAVSRQQKERWYKAINRTVGLDIETSLQRQGSEEIKAIINDAVKAIRDRLWSAPEGNRLRLHNIDYGFARNLTGLRPIWIVFAVGSSLGCWVGYIWYGQPLLWCIVSTIIAIAVVPLGFAVLPGYVRQKAHFYAESFFGALMAYYEGRGRRKA
jgi:hypothetical protein